MPWLDKKTFDIKKFYERKKSTFNLLTIASLEPQKGHLRLTTFTKGISNSIIEYMSLGKPVISTDINGGSREIIIEGETGYCTERNTEKVVAAINFLLNNEKLRESMGNKGRERINSHFSIDKFGNEFDIVYKEVLARKKQT